MGLAIVLGQFIDECVVVLGHILLTAQRAEVCELQSAILHDLEDLALVCVLLALVLAVPGYWASRLPVGFHSRTEHVPLYLVGVCQRSPDLAARGVDLGSCSGNVPLHGVLLVPLLPHSLTTGA